MKQRLDREVVVRPCDICFLLPVTVERGLIPQMPVFRLLLSTLNVGFADGVPDDRIAGLVLKKLSACGPTR